MLYRYREQRMSHLSGNRNWSTGDELQRLEALAETAPLKLLAAYNGTFMRDEWGGMDSGLVKEAARKHAKRLLITQPELGLDIPKDWPYARALAQALGKGA